jgi:hypothetical protein
LTGPVPRTKAQDVILANPWVDGNGVSARRILHAEDFSNDAQKVAEDHVLHAVSIVLRYWWPQGKHESCKPISTILRFSKTLPDLNT